MSKKIIIAPVTKELILRFINSLENKTYIREVFKGVKKKYPKLTYGIFNYWVQSFINQELISFDKIKVKTLHPKKPVLFISPLQFKLK